MLKEVGASGQISLGKKYAGQLFDMQIAADGAVTLTPVKVVPIVQEDPAVYKVSDDGYHIPARMARKAAAAARSPAQAQALHDQWEADNQEALQAMNRRMAKIGSMGMRVQAWRKHKTLEAQSAEAASPGEVK